MASEFVQLLLRDEQRFPKHKRRHARRVIESARADYLRAFGTVEGTRLADALGLFADGPRLPGYWTRKRCIEDALRFKTRYEWKGASTGGYNAARRGGWLVACCAHMTRQVNPNGYWTLERCRANALRFGSRMAWKRGNSSGYSAARREGWLDTCCAHMHTRQHKPKGYWTLARCRADARRFKTRKEWERGNKGAYAAALAGGWLDACCAHMTWQHKPAGFWTLERCRADARQYRTRNEWQRAHMAAYIAARQNGWLAACTSHMPKRAKPKQAALKR